MSKWVCPECGWEDDDAVVCAKCGLRMVSANPSISYPASFFETSPLGSDKPINPTINLCGFPMGRAPSPPATKPMRTFDTGATRNVDTDKLDFEGFLSPAVLERFAQYMHKHRIQADGSLRDSDNWQKGIPCDAYMKSGFRHFFDWWKHHRGLESPESLEESLCALLFNVQGYLYEVLKEGRDEQEES